MVVRVLAPAVLAALLVGSAGARGVQQAQAAKPCPVGALPLTKDALVRAIAAALRAERKEDADAMAVSALLAIYDRSPRGAQVLRCGRKAFERSVIVYFTRRAYLPAQSASQGVSFVARFPGGYRVWLRAH
jgi:hypothetical protein